MYPAPLSPGDDLSTAHHMQFLVSFLSVFRWLGKLNCIWGEILQSWSLVMSGHFYTINFYWRSSIKVAIFRRNGFIILSPIVMEMYPVSHIFPQKYTLGHGWYWGALAQTWSERWHGPMASQTLAMGLIRIINADHRQLICGNPQLTLAPYFPPLVSVGLIISMADGLGSSWLSPGDGL